MAKSKIVKIPKSVRKGPILDFVNSKTGRVLIAQALTAAIGVFAYKHASPETRERVGEKFRKGTDDAREYLEGNLARLSFAFGEAVTAFRTALGQPGESQSIDSAIDTDAEGGKKSKKQNWSSSEPANPQ